jgi:sugar transferase (PEP-CTERM system associated)
LVRLFNVYFPVRTLVLILGEAVIVAASFTAAALVPVRGDLGALLASQSMMMKIGLASGICLLIIYYHDLYDNFILSNSRELTARIIQVLGVTSLAMSLVYFFFPNIRLNTPIFVLAALLVGILSASWRKLFIMVNQSARFAQRAIILGDGALAGKLVKEINAHPELGMRLVGHLSRERELPETTRLGSLDDLGEIVERENIKQIFVAMEERRGRMPVEFLLELKTRGIKIQDGADFYETATGKIPLESLRLSWLLFSPGFRISPVMRVYKRVASLLLSAVGLVLCLPLMAIIAVAIRLDSKGPVIYRQKRMGKNGKTFTVYKFRSMYDGSDAAGLHVPAAEGDNRITRVGRFLRKVRLDEVPQLYNILKGDMSFVGPRPFVPDQEEELIKKIPFYRQRLTAHPGATGWAQINYGYCSTIEDNREKLAYDLFYIKNVSFGLDFLILFRTIKTLLLGKGAR